MAGIIDYTDSANSNTNIAGINIAENCLAANINNAIRQLMADVLIQDSFAPADVSATASMSFAGVQSGYFDISLTASIVHLGTARAGYRKIVRFKAPNTVLVNSANLILPTSSNITTVSNDVGIFISLGSGAWVLGGGTVVRATSAGGVRAVSGTSDTILSTDNGKLVTFSNASAIAVTLPQATGSFISPFSVDLENKGAGVVTVTPTTSTINGATTLVLGTNEGARVFSDSTNYDIQRGMRGGAYAAKTGAYTVTSSDNNNVINWTTAGATATLTAAATLGAGFTVTLMNTAASGDVTIDPNASETLDGLTTRLLRPGGRVRLVCDGTNWRTLQGIYPFESADQAPTISAQIVVAHGLGVIPKDLRIILVNRTGELGYVAGEEVDLGAAYMSQATANVTTSIQADATNVNIANSGEAIRIQHKTTPTTTASNIAIGNWKYIVRAKDIY